MQHNDKINRELFIGNTSPETSDAVLKAFLNACMSRVGLTLPNFPHYNGGQPIIQVRVTSKFAFAQARTEVREFERRAESTFTGHRWPSDGRLGHLFLRC